jgi:hypothetical protein
MNTRYIAAITLILVAAFSRLIPHPDNFTAVGAMAIFAGSVLRSYRALILPVVALWLSDILLNNVIYAQYYDGFVWFTGGFTWIAVPFVIAVLLGRLAHINKTNSFILPAFITPVLFYLVSNFGVWMSGTMYPKTATGLMMCYQAGLPFLRNDLLGMALFLSIMVVAYRSWVAREQWAA